MATRRTALPMRARNWMKEGCSGPPRAICSRKPFSRKRSDRANWNTTGSRPLRPLHGPCEPSDSEVTRSANLTPGRLRLSEHRLVPVRSVLWPHPRRSPLAHELRLSRARSQPVSAAVPCVTARTDSVTHGVFQVAYKSRRRLLLPFGRQHGPEELAADGHDEGRSTLISPPPLRLPARAEASRAAGGRAFVGRPPKIWRRAGVARAAAEARPSSRSAIDLDRLGVEGPAATVAETAPVTEPGSRKRFAAPSGW